MNEHDRLVDRAAHEARTVMFIGGLDAGKSPITFKGVVAGKYQLHITLSGYAPVDREVEVKAGQFLDLGTITLQRNQPTAITDNRPEPSVMPTVMPSAAPPGQTVPPQFAGCHNYFLPGETAQPF